MLENISTTEGAVLGLLATSGEHSGYDLSRLAEQSIAFLWTPSQSQIYKVLPRLAAAGLARVREIDILKPRPSLRRPLGTRSMADTPFFR